MTTSPYFSLQQAAEYLGVGPAAVRTYIAQGDLRAYKLGHGSRSPIRVLKSDVEALLHEIPTIKVS